MLRYVGTYTSNQGFHTYRAGRTVSLYPLTNNFLIAVTKTYLKASCICTRGRKKFQGRRRLVVSWSDHQRKFRCKFPYQKQERSVYLKAMKNLTRSDLWRKDQKNIEVSFDRRRKQQNEYYKYWKTTILLRNHTLKKYHIHENPWFAIHTLCMPLEEKLRRILLEE